VTAPTPGYEAAVARGYLALLAGTAPGQAALRSLGYRPGEQPRTAHAAVRMAEEVAQHLLRRLAP
jgi:hypothetical protein